jgi:hypothetical protein
MAEEKRARLASVRDGAEATRDRGEPGSNVYVGLCHWCGASFTPRSNGRRQRFCSPECKSAFWVALQRWAAAEFEATRVTVEKLRLL